MLRRLPRQTQEGTLALARLQGTEAILSLTPEVSSHPCLLWAASGTEAVTFQGTQADSGLGVEGSDGFLPPGWDRTGQQGEPTAAVVEVGSWAS